MPLIKYQDFRFRRDALDIISKANVIIKDYAAQGFDLTLRQLYYQFVARGYITNTVASYKKLGTIVNDARLAGQIDWNAIVDRTRNLRSLSHWDSPSEIVRACAEQYRVDWWKGQDYRVEVWIEKDALVGVLESVCPQLDVPYFSCRGYTSQSEMWGAAMRLTRRWIDERQRTVVLHFGDHDPSGIDMTRDIEDRIHMFTSHHGAKGCLEMRRLALNMAQITQYDPPPNPAKTTDTRYAAYRNAYGDESWELDALEPTVLADLIRDEISGLIDEDLMDARKKEQIEAREQLSAVSDRWNDVVEFVEQ